MFAFLKVLALAVVGLALMAPTASSGPSRADLSVTFWTSPPEVAVRESLFDVAFIVRNTGRRTAPSSRAGVFLSKDKQRDARDFKLGEIPVRRLRPGSSSLRSMTLRVPNDAAGSYFLLFCADSKRQVRESNERNCRSSVRLGFVRGI